MKNIEIQIPVSDLRNVLPGLAKIVSRHTSLPVLRCVKVSLDPSGQVVSLQANNLDEVATVRLQAQAGGTPGELLMPFDMLNKLIKGCAADQSVWFIANKSETKIRYTLAGNCVDRLVEHLPAVEFPEAKVIDRPSTALDEAFKLALKEALDCASEDASRYVLNGACLDVRDKDAHYVVGTDGRHLYSANSFRFDLPESLIMPAQKFLTWPGFVDDGLWRLKMLPAVRVDPEDKKADKSKEEPPWFQLDSDHWSYLTRGIDAQYPNWKQVVPTQTSKWTRLLLAPESVAMMQQAVPLLPGADLTNQTVILRVTPEQVLLCGRGNNDKQDTRMVIPAVSVEGGPVHIGLNRTFLLQALRFGLTQLRIQDRLAPMVFSSPAKTMIVSPITVEEPEPAKPAAPQSAPAEQNQTSPPENASAGPPSPAVVATTTETTTERTNTVNTPTTPMTAPARGNLKTNGNGNGAEENGSAMKTAIEQVEKVRAALRQTLSDLNDVVSALKAAEKENKTANKEIESVRQTLRSLQSVAI